MSSQRYSPHRLYRAMTGALLRRGVSERHAAYVADGLLEASLRGVDTHGVRLFATYLSELDGGRAKARPELSWTSGAPATRVLDAGGALGLVAGRIGCDAAVELAKEHGVGVVVVKNSNHFGPASYYTLQMARAGAIGFSCTNSDALVAPFSGRDPFIGTNPLSLAALGNDGDTFCADLATSQISYSKVKHKLRQGEALESGWAVAEDGTDAGGQSEGQVAALKPLGGYKGQCLGMMVEVLSAVLAGEPLDHELSHLYEPPYDRPRRVAHFFLAMDLPAFTDPDAFRGRLSSLCRQVRDQDAVGDEPVVVPGDPEAASTTERRQQGIPLLDSEVSWLPAEEKLAEEEAAKRNEQRH
ncbi:MAG: Ldh family oxidoreductase [Acidobacteriota bacterium]|nr:Ldh family oxidoreductase [Acidobacteriota bacterium]